MSCCIGITQVRREQALPAGAEVDGATVSTLVLNPGVKQVFTVRRETDARTAATRGLADYLAQLSLEVEQRDVRFQRVFDHWAEPEDRAKYPSACVYALGSGRYVRQFTPNCRAGVEVAGPPGFPRQFLVDTGELVLDLVVEVWATDPVMRMGLAAMLEDGLDPHEWRGGALLDLPFYHNVRATYDLTDLNYTDDEDNAAQGNWTLQATVRAVVPVVRLKTLPGMRPRATVVVQEGPL